MDNNYENQKDTYTKKINDCYKYICSETETDDPDVMLLKGGSYKIKGYYLENNKLNDIRGASVNLSYVEDTVIPDVIKEKFDENCIIYNGGGNIFCILPGSVTEDFAKLLEEEAQKYLISASTAYVIMRAKLSDIKGKYKETMAELENKLAERKKLKIAMDSNPESVFLDTGIPWSEPPVIKLDAKKYEGTELCGLCKSKTAGYIIDIVNEKIKVCASCLHKNRIGSEARKSKYIQEYIKYVGAEPQKCKSLGEIDKDYVAVVYGDGNNMGQIIQNFTEITDMMEFSDNVKNASNRAVFETMKNLNIKRFEVVGLGGDDVFVIVSGKVAIDFAMGLIEIYNNEFKRTDEELKQNKNPYKSTMSVGICIAKTNTPVRIMLEVAESKLKSAKEQAKRDNAAGCDEGSIAFSIMSDSTETDDRIKNKFNAAATLQPYSTNNAKKILALANNIKKQETNTLLYNIYNAYVVSDTEEEAELFLKYQNAKSKKKFILPELDGYELKNSLYCLCCNDEEEKAFIWKDILDLINFSNK